MLIHQAGQGINAIWKNARITVISEEAVITEHVGVKVAGNEKTVVAECSSCRDSWG